MEGAVRGLRQNDGAGLAARITRASFMSLLLPFAFLLLTSPVGAQYAQPPVGPRPTGKSDEVLKQVGIDQRLNNQIPLDLKFRDELGSKPWEIGKDGCVRPLDKPGIGVEIDEKFLEAHPVIEGPGYV